MDPSPDMLHPAPNRCFKGSTVVTVIIVIERNWWIIIGDAPKRIREDVVEVDVDAIDIPHGRWRVVTSHVPERRFMIAKFATNAEIAEARKIIAITEEDVGRKRKKDVDDQGFTYTWSTEQKVRPGLNVFDEKGNELEWDYEHDTRFYDDPNVSSEKDESKSVEAESGAPQARVVRGRGAKKGSFLYNGVGNTLASDELDSSTLERWSRCTPQRDRGTCVRSLNPGCFFHFDAFNDIGRHLVAVYRLH
ncbi:hypothetical protein Y032_0312g2174 [Ancylostoma ceylanicum]|uniref:Uncharacterized protein n=1 Tax=Ancylostoma ceylanicum TaxID=53326 RepID=A0A016S1Z2_9BILA|nr:hypothetical protein Y032_0312g2174 [Ancylostoma ceylanicum]